jgi:hypothetical protein
VSWTPGEGWAGLRQALRMGVGFTTEGKNDGFIDDGRTDLILCFQSNFKSFIVFILSLSKNDITIIYLKFI